MEKTLNLILLPIRVFFFPSTIGSNRQGTSLTVKDLIAMSKGQGLPKWSPIVCQGSGHDVYCGWSWPAGYDMIIVIKITALATFLTCRL